MNMSACNGVDTAATHNCDEINSWECYKPGIRDDCCQTCGEVKNDFSFLNIPGCDYGDHYPGCVDITQIFSHYCYNNTVQRECCETCFSLETNIPGCRYGDRVSGCLSETGPNGRHCYNNTVREYCCATCFSQQTNIQGCEYGDRAGSCMTSLCMSSMQYDHDCCNTCQSSGSPNPPPTDQTTMWSSTLLPTTDPGTTSDSPVMPKASGSSGTPGWVVPVAAGAGGVVVLAIIILVIIFCIRRRKSKPEAISDEMYKEYKLSKRAPVAPPRPDIEDDKNTKLKRQDSAEYAYIHPNDVGKDSVKETTLKKRDSNDPLPKVPGEYVYLGNPDKYGYLEPLARSSNPGPYADLQSGTRQHDPYTHLHQATAEQNRRNNSYQGFPVTHDNRGFEIESEKL